MWSRIDIECVIENRSLKKNETKNKIKKTKTKWTDDKSLIGKIKDLSKHKKEQSRSSVIEMNTFCDRGRGSRIETECLIENLGETKTVTVHRYSGLSVWSRSKSKFDSAVTFVLFYFHSLFCLTHYFSKKTHELTIISLLVGQITFTFRFFCTKKLQPTWMSNIFFCSVLIHI